MKSYRPSSALMLVALLLLMPSLGQAQKKSSARGLVTAQDIAKYPNDSLERIIARMVSGVEVVRLPTGGEMLRIRGAISLPDGKTGEYEERPPLYVIDGVPIRTSDGSLPSLDPQDVDSVRVLKGTETALYGIEGADGVIVFTTRRGKPRGN